MKINNLTHFISESMFRWSWNQIYFHGKLSLLSKRKLYIFLVHEAIKWYFKYLTSVIENDWNERSKVLEFFHPVRNRRQRSDDEERTGDSHLDLKKKKIRR